jgi:Ser/Thr protein kinase RdoA (MazF antagonist)
MANAVLDDFFRLDPDTILDSVDEVLAEAMPGVRCTGKSLALNSLENRVYDLELDCLSSSASGGMHEHVVTKFYRPGRWSEEQIQEEHEFLFALDEAEIPVVSPWRLDDQSLFRCGKTGIWFALFSKVQGRLRDELDPERLRTLGRYIGRIHNLGDTFRFRHRVPLTPENWGRKPMEYLLQSGLIDPIYRERYRAVANALIERAEVALRGVPTLSLHGDCHLGNCLWQMDSPFFLDFDDSTEAPAVQDIWMVVRGRGFDADRDREALLEGYEAFRPFDRSTLRLIEPLRALRMIHYSAWIARRWQDPSFPKAFPQFRTPRYWEEDIQALQEVLALMENTD